MRRVDEAFLVLVRNEVGAGSAHKLVEHDLLYRRRSLEKVDDGGDGFLVSYGQ